MHGPQYGPDPTAQQPTPGSDYAYPYATAAAQTPPRGDPGAADQQPYQSPTTGEAVPGPSAAGMMEAPAPPTDIIDQSDTVLIVVDLPGCKPEHIQLQVHEQGLTVFADREEEFDELGNAFQRERPARVQRSVWVPETADLSDAEAFFENGVLTVTVPKTAEAPGGTLPIQTRTES